MSIARKKLELIHPVGAASPGGALTGCLEAILHAFDCDTPDRSPLAPNQPKPDLANSEETLLSQHHLILAIGKAGGLEVRELHPPEAAPLPIKPPEFDLHWRDSYLPFIREALRRDEPILAYQGWPAAAGNWGIITAIDMQDRCTGETCAGKMSMTGPAMLAYVFSKGK